MSQSHFMTMQAGPPVGMPGGQKLYFAYGSNLNLPQMAQRSPGSVLVGLATLRGYRWQINERGVANVVPVADGDESGGGSASPVQGLAYLVTPQDEASLDRYEGTSRGLYQKRMLPVQLLPHPRYAGWTTEEVSLDLAQRLGGRGGLLPEEDLPMSGFDAGIPGVGQPAATTEELALVYVSENHTRDGRIRDEYVGRMQIAVHYALALGMSQAFVDSVIAPHLSGRQGREEEAAEANSPGGEPAAAPGCGVAGCMHGSQRLCRLRLENRQPHEASGIRFDAGLLAVLAQRMAEAEQDEAAETLAGRGSRTARRGPVYVVVLQAPLVGTEASYGIEAVTHSLALANELAMKSFRDACSEADWEHGSAGGSAADNGSSSSSSNNTSKNAVIGPVVVAQHLLSRQPGTFGCVLDDKRCLLLVCTLPNGSQVRAWVTAQELLE